MTIQKRKQKIDFWIYNVKKLEIAVKIAHSATKIVCYSLSPCWTAMECRDNVPSWSGPSLPVDDNIQAQGRFSCECLPDHHWDSAGVGREDEKEQYKAVNTRLWCERWHRRGRTQITSLRDGCNWGFTSHLVWNRVPTGLRAADPRHCPSPCDTVPQLCSVEATHCVADGQRAVKRKEVLTLVFPSTMAWNSSTFKPHCKTPSFQVIFDQFNESQAKKRGWWHLILCYCWGEVEANCAAFDFYIKRLVKFSGHKWNI